MKIEKTPIDDLVILHRPVRRDSRGFFSRLFGADELAAVGLSMEAVHVNTSTSVEKGTMRGVHFQYPPFAEKKLVSCTAGAIWDVGIDLRLDSPTRFQWFGIELTPDNGRSLIIPEGFGHAFITLEPNTTAVYVVSSVYAPEYESGLKYDDSILAIDWPIAPSVISDKDQVWGELKDRMDELNQGFS